MKQLLVTSLEQGAQHREEMVRIVQEAHHTQSQQAQKQSQQAQEQMQEMKQQQSQQMQEQMMEMKQLLTSPCKQRGLATRRLQAAIRGHQGRRAVHGLLVQAHRRWVRALSWPGWHAAATKIQAAYRGLRRRAYEFGGCIAISRGRWDDHDEPQVTRLWHVHGSSFMRYVQCTLHRRVWWDHLQDHYYPCYCAEMSESEWRSAQWGWHRAVQKQCIFAVRDLDELISQGVCSLECVVRLRETSTSGIDASFVQRVLASSDSVFGGRSPVAHEASASSNCQGGGVSERALPGGRGLAE